MGTWDSDDTNYSSARFFGSDLMRPAAGDRRYYHSGALAFRGAFGVYWSRSERSASDDPLFLIFDRQVWPEDTVRLRSLLSGPVDDLVGYIPDFGFELYDLRRFSDDQIKGTIMNRVMLLLFKYIFKPELRHKLPEIFSCSGH